MWSRLLFTVLSASFSLHAAAEEIVLHFEDLEKTGTKLWVAKELPFPAMDPGLPIVGPSEGDAVAGMLRRLSAQGKAAGFGGIAYDNRDRGHSSLPIDMFPRLARWSYSTELRVAGLDFGLAGSIILPGMTFGNSSTAVTRGPYPRSLPRYAMTYPGEPERAFHLYESNQLYVYPEHRDHDEPDLFPANWPYMITSQGSSGSDKPFLRAIALALASFGPETRQRLREEGLIAPTLRMILRRSQSSVLSGRAYRSSIAHPTVFESAGISPERMVAMAATMRAASIAPMVRLEVEQEDFSTTAGLDGRSEHLFDTPSAISRLWRGLEYTHEMLVSAEATRDPNDRKLTFSWVLLRGDPNKVRITPLDPSGIRARVSIDWHDAFVVGANKKRLSNRVDIGVIASNGVNDSAPAFISIAFPSHQLREYSTSAEHSSEVPRLVSIDYDAIARGAQFDPILFWSAPWSDIYQYDNHGQLSGWTRVGEDIDMAFDLEDGEVSYEIQGAIQTPELRMSNPPEQ